MTFQEHNDALLGIHRATLVTLDKTLAERDALASELTTTKADLAKAEARIKVLEAQLATTTRTTTQPPTTTKRTTTIRTTTPAPTVPPGQVTKPPAILLDRFATLDMKQYYADKVPSGVAVSDRVMLAASGDVLLKWSKATAVNSSDMRAQMGIRAVYGGGETPRRDPVESERWYGTILSIDPTFPITDQWSDEKCVLPQYHQGNANGIVNPPASVELINIGSDSIPESILRLVLSIPAMVPDRINFPLGGAPKARSALLFHVRWFPDSRGLFEAWRDGVKLPWVHHGPTCNSQAVAGQGLNSLFADYNPGHGSGSFAAVPSGWKRWVHYHRIAIGNETNSLADMLAALA